MKTMNGQRVVILGGTRGIGRAVAERVAAERAQVVIASSQQASVDAALATLPPGATGHAVDLRSVDAVAALFERIGELDHLVYTAGEPLMLGPLGELDLTAARDFFELRYWGALAAVKAARSHFRAGGSIVLTSGTVGTRPHAGFAIGASICGAMEALTRTLAIELAPIRANIVIPGFVDTDLWGNVPAAARETLFREAAAKLPVKRIGTADDIAEHYLAFMRGGYTTGQSVIVDGGGVLV
jgi:NAD(P)-dependent dehydrogenase (short-subunit alcohol dehydrogenase family)